MMKGHTKEDTEAKHRARAPLPAAPLRTPLPASPLAKAYWTDPMALTAEFDRYFDAMRRNMGDWFMPLWSAPPRLLAEPFPEIALPRADFRDEGEAFTIAVEVPGFARDDLEVEVTADRLEVVAKRERAEEREAKDEDFLARERSYRELRRSFEFPSEVLPDKVSAELKDGVLTLRAPKERPTPAAHPVRVKVG
jgi:HSP20 family protein